MPAQTGNIVISSLVNGTSAGVNNAAVNFGDIWSHHTTDGSKLSKVNASLTIERLYRRVTDTFIFILTNQKLLI